jgi:hypothetical protein
MESEKETIILIGDTHTDEVATKIRLELVEKAVARAIVFVDEGLRAPENAVSTHHLILDDQDITMLQQLCRDRYMLKAERPTSAFKRTIIPVYILYDWLLFVKVWSLFVKQMQVRGWRADYDENSVRRMVDVMKGVVALCKQLQHGGMSDVERASARGEIFLSLIQQIWSIRQELRQFLTFGIETLATVLGNNRVAVLFLSKMSIDDLLDDYDEKVWLWLMQMRNFAMARNIFLARISFPGVEVVAQMGVTHIERGVTVQAYLHDIFNLRSRTLVADASFRLDTLSLYLSHSLSINYSSCANCGSPQVSIRSCHTGRVFCNRRCFDRHHHHIHSAHDMRSEY